MVIQVGENELLEINSPCTVEFEIVRTNLGESNTANFTIYNLSKTNRGKIFKDVNTPQVKRAIEFFAGYSEKKTDILPRCFKGEIKRAISQRTGSDFKTVIEAFDGSTSQNPQVVSETTPAGTSNMELLTKLTSSMSGVDTITMGTSAGLLNIAKRSTAIFGPIIDVVKQLSNDKFYIDSGNAYVLGDNEVVNGEIRLLDANNGIIGTPRRGELYTEIDMIFEPRIKPSQLIELKTITEDRFNGVYKVTGIIHRGTISGAVAGTCITTLTLQYQKNYKVVFDASKNEYRAEQ
jgi:hypothetical protein